MSPEFVSRYIQRLPTFITFFFSAMLVRNVGELSTIFKFTTGPEFEKFTLGDWLTMLSFLSTLFFVVLCWLAYNVLVDRFPYTADYGFFFLDVVRFLILYVILNFAFLAGHPPSYLYYIISLGVFHTFAMGWHVLRIRRADPSEHAEHHKDIRFLGSLAAAYYLLAVVYALAVLVPWTSAQPWYIHTVLVLITSALVIFVSADRMHAMRVRVLAVARSSDGTPTK